MIVKSCALQFVCYALQFVFHDVCVRLSVRPSVCLSVRLSVRPSVRLSVCPSVRLSVRPSVCLSVRLSVRPSVRLSVCPSVRLSVCPSVCLSVRLSVCPSVCLSVRLSVHLQSPLSPVAPALQRAGRPVRYATLIVPPRQQAIARPHLSAGRCPPGKLARLWRFNATPHRPPPTIASVTKSYHYHNPFGQCTWCRHEANQHFTHR